MFKIMKLIFIKMNKISYLYFNNHIALKSQDHENKLRNV